MTASAFLRRTGCSVGVVAACTVTLFTGVAGAALAAAAPPPANARVEIVTSPSVQVTYTGLAGANLVSLDNLADGRFRFTDVAPIEVGPGCLVAKASPGQFAAICDAPTLSPGVLKAVKINLGAGDDSFQTASPAGVRVDGGPGNDVITGGPVGDQLRDSQGKDTLRGGPGADTLDTDGASDTLTDTLEGDEGDDDLHGNVGNDVLSGGPGQDVMRGDLGGDTFDGGADFDTVTYMDNGHGSQRLVITIDGVNDDGLRPLFAAQSEENDNVTASVEKVVGNAGDDTITGNDDPNTLDGNSGRDTLIGLKGADHLLGRAGDDTLASNRAFGVPVQDGAIDTLSGDTGFDTCRVPFVNVEADVTNSCEAINQD